MLEIFQHDFMIRAFAAGIVTAIIAPSIGLFLVTRRYSFLADTLAHVSFAGVAAAAITGTQPIIASLIASIGAALCVERLRETRTVLGESALSLFLSGGLALAAVLLSIAPGASAGLSGLLFGSIATVASEDLWLIGTLGGAVIVIIALLYRPLFCISLDEELALAGGLPAGWINRLLIVLAAVTVSVSMRVVGVLLVGALMVIPVLAAMQWERSFLKTFFLSVAISLLSTCIGLIASYELGIASGGTIVLVCIAFFLLGVLRKRLSA